MRTVAALQPRSKLVLSRSLSFFGYSDPVPTLLPAGGPLQNVFNMRDAQRENEKLILPVNRRQVGEGPLLVFTCGKTELGNKRPHKKLDWGNFEGVKPRCVSFVTCEHWHHVIECVVQDAQIRGQIIELDRCPEAVVLSSDIDQRIFICKAEEIILQLGKNPQATAKNIEPMLAGILLGLNEISLVGMDSIRCRDILLGSSEMRALRVGVDWGRQLLTYDDPRFAPARNASSVLRKQ